LQRICVLSLTYPPATDGYVTDRACLILSNVTMLSCWVRVLFGVNTDPAALVPPIRYSSAIA
jgi:hypothetical protein